MSDNRYWQNVFGEIKPQQTRSSVRNWFRTLTWPIRQLHKAVATIEPWGILFAVIGLFLSLWAFQIDRQERAEDRANRQRDLIDRSWTRILNAYPANQKKAGIRDALETLVSLGVSLDGISLDSEHVDAAVLAFADLEGANFRGAVLTLVNLRGANLKGADLTNANLMDADLSGANLKGAKAKNDDIHKAVLCNTILPSGGIANRDC